MPSDLPYAPEHTSRRMRALFRWASEQGRVATKVDFARELEIDKSHLNKLLKGDRAPSNAVMDSAYKAFQVTSDWLLYDRRWTLSPDHRRDLVRHYNDIVAEDLGPPPV